MGSTLTAFLIAVLGAWSALLTFLLVLIVRQVGIVTLHLAMIAPAVDGGMLKDDGPTVGSRIPDDVAQLLPAPTLQASNVVLISATCTGCRNLVDGMRGHLLRSDTVILLAGHGNIADVLHEAIPKSAFILRDPEATRVANGLKIESTPFAITIRDSVVIKKGYVSDPQSFIPQLEETPPSHNGRSLLTISENTLFQNKVRS